jgi:hypothetical protein
VFSNPLDRGSLADFLNIFGHQSVPPQVVACIGVLGGTEHVVETTSSDVHGWSFSLGAVQQFQDFEPASHLGFGRVKPLAPFPLCHDRGPDKRRHLASVRGGALD